MTHKYLTLFLTVAALLTASARDLNLVWDANPPAQGVTGYRVYERFGVSPAYTYTEVGETDSTTTSFQIANITEALHVYVVTAFRYYPEIEQEIESPYSSPAWWAPSPSAPTTLRVTLAGQQASIKFNVEPAHFYALQATSDFFDWETLFVAQSGTPLVFEYQDPATAAKRFYRVEVQ